MSKNKKNKHIECSFCGVTQNEIIFLVEGNNAFICDVCIAKAQDALIANQNCFLNSLNM